jgi:DNA-binding MarR family transcriptional regulator
MTERSVRTAIKELTVKGIISSVESLTDRRRREYFLNPYGSWKGSAKQRHEMIAEIDPDQLQLFGRNAKQLKESEREDMKHNR